MGSGIAVTKVAGKYFFKNATGELLGECNVPGESVDAIDGIKIIDNMVDEKILLDDYKKIRELSIKNPNTNTNSMTLGKYLKDSNGNPLSSAYTKMAESTGDTYFDLGAKWNEIKKTYKLSDKDMFKLFNEPALDDAVSAGKEIRFSQDPRAYGDCALKDEWEYLKSKYDYEDLIKEGDYWYAIK